MKAPRILANVSNLLVTVFLIVLIPATLVGTYYIVKNSSDIKKNTEFREKYERMEIVNDSLNLELSLEKRLNKMHRKIIKNDTAI